MHTIHVQLKLQNNTFIRTYDLVNNISTYHQHCQIVNSTKIFYDAKVSLLLLLLTFAKPNCRPERKINSNTYIFKGENKSDEFK